MSGWWIIGVLIYPSSNDYGTHRMTMEALVLAEIKQYWAAREAGDTFVLTTTCQPVGIWGNNKELESYHKGCLDHKLYVSPKHEVAFGLSGRVFLKRTYEQTQNVHDYPEDQRPPCDDAIFTRTWGSFAVPLIDNNKCLGVLEFVLDNGNASYDHHIGRVCNALKQAGFQYSFRTDHIIRNYVNARERSRRTDSSEFTSYSRLVPHFGRSREDAATKLRETTGKLVRQGTFRNASKNAGIPEWPCIPKGKSTTASSDLETQVNPSASGTSSFATSIATEHMPGWDALPFDCSDLSNLHEGASPNQNASGASGCTERLVECRNDFMQDSNEMIDVDVRDKFPDMLSDFKTQVSPTASDASSSRTPTATKYGSFGFLSHSDSMASNTSYFGAPIPSSGDPTDDMDVVHLLQSHYSDDKIHEWSYAESMATTDTSQTTYDASSLTTPYATEYIESDATFSWDPFAMKHGSIASPFAAKDTWCFEGATAPETLTNQNASDAGGCTERLVVSRNDFMPDSNEMKDVDVRDEFPDMLSDFTTQVNPSASGTSSFETTIATGHMPSWNTEISKSSCIQTTTIQAPFSEYLINQIECDTSSFGDPVDAGYMVCENSSLGSLNPTYHMSDYSSLIPIRDGEISEWPYTQGMATVDKSQTAYDASCLMTPYAAPPWAPFATIYSSFASPFATEDTWCFEGASPSKTLANQNAFGGGGCTERLVESRNVSCNIFTEDVRDKFPAILSDFDSWANQYIQDYL